jgi:hypothetical protein
MLHIQLVTSFISLFFKPFERLVPKSTDRDHHLSKHLGHIPTSSPHFQNLGNLSSRFREEKYDDSILIMRHENLGPRSLARVCDHMPRDRGLLGA